MSKAVASISMPVEMMQRLKESAKVTGLNFSARAVQLIEMGEIQEAFANRKLTTNFGSPDLAPTALDHSSKPDAAQDEEVTRGITPESDEPASGPSDNYFEGWPVLADDFEDIQKVYACVSDTKRSVEDIARYTGIKYDNVGEILEGLAEEGEPIILRREKGEGWVCHMGVVTDG